MSKNLPISPAELLERLKKSCKLASVVQETIYHQIISDTARAEGIKVSDLELQQAADDFRLKYSLSDPAITWEWFENNYLTGDDFEELISESVVAAKLIQHLFGDRVEPYFYQHQLDFTQAALYEIVFDDFGVALEQFYAIEEKETTFAQIARQYIQEPNLRRQHGYLGVLSRTALNSQISAAVFASNPPQVLKPITVNKKIHLILVEEIIQPHLDELLREQIVNQLFSAWLEKQVQEYSIELDPQPKKIPTIVNHRH
jgi:parvulin-like peptidyl-prolyl isomerase